ncbi:MAG: biotin--[acetyl-CoA-carboxylase] ligase [Candidatus Omnitrophica bacterium]|nr:biotin--[acetyl-CoA-carboxylase] ligase [Candidatus Omnitrophota bacterium]
MQFRILHYDTLNSTNDLALELARAGAREGTVVTAEYQKHGRGRMKRRWTSPRGKGLLFSIILRPQVKTGSAAYLTHVAASAVSEVLKKKFKLKTTLKRPNDVLVKGKKIAGILTESSAYHHRIEYVVLGIGLNVNTERSRMLRSATSIYAETKRRSFPKDSVLETVLKVFETKYHHFVQTKSKPEKQPEEALI